MEVLANIRDTFSSEIKYINQDNSELTDTDLLRIKLHEFYSQTILRKADLNSFLHTADEDEEELKSNIESIAKSCEGDDCSIVIFKHTKERYKKLQELNILTNQRLTGDLKKSNTKYDSSYLELVDDLDEIRDFMYKRFLPYTLGIDRSKMPQIDDNEKLKKKLKLKEGKLRLDELKPTQNAISEDKVLGMLYGGYKLPNEFIVSSDNYILDGHHRWAACLEIFDTSTMMNVYQSDLKMEDLLIKLKKGSSEDKVGQVMGEFKDGTLKHSSGDKVTSRKMAIAIALSEAGLSKAEDIEAVLHMFIEKGEDVRRYVAGCLHDGSKMLFLKRASNDKFHPNTWNLPSGGIDDGETPREAMRREFYEETNLVITDLWLEKVINETDACIYYYNVQCDMMKSPIALLDNENQQYQWWDETEWGKANLILDLREHLLKIKLPKEEIVKGIYVNNLENRKKGIVGQHYGKVEIKTTDTPEFKAWFGNSKVVYPDGSPMVVYHGTQEEFTEFEGDSFFTDDFFNADGYAGGEIVYEVYLSMQNPLIVDAKNKKWDDIKTPYGSSTQEVIGNVDRDKYDGVIFKNIKDSWIDDVDYQDAGNIYVAFKPNQIKSTDNVKFDPNSNDITKGKKGHEGLVEKKVLVHKPGIAPFYQTKWVKIDKDAKKVKLKKLFALDALALKFKIPSDILKDLLKDIDYITIAGVDWKLVEDKKTHWFMEAKGEDGSKNNLIVLKDSTKIGEKERGEKEKKKEFDLDTAKGVIKTAYEKSILLTANGKSWKVLKFDMNEVALNVDGDLKKMPYKEFAKIVLDQLKKNKEKFDKSKNFNKIDIAVKDDDFKKLKDLGGSTGAILVEDKNGQKWVRKGGNSKAHRENELLAINLYKELGADVPYETKVTKDYIYNKFVEGESLGQWMNGKSGVENKEMFTKIGNYFVIDSLLGAWDVIGLGYDNIVIDKAGVPIRVDVGGALEFRAMGEKKKPDQWELAEGVSELNTLVDPNMNEQSAMVFNIAEIDIAKQVDELPDTLPSWIPLGQRKIIQNRIDFLKAGYEGLPTNLEDMGDLYPIKKEHSKDLKAFYTRLNKAMEFTQKDQKLLSKIAETDDHAKAMMDEKTAKAYIGNSIAPDKLKEYVDKIGINFRELYALRQHTGSYSGAINASMKKLVGEEWNTVEEGKVVKYKPEFQEMAKDAFNLNNLVHKKLKFLQLVIDRAKEKGHEYAVGGYGVSTIQELKSIRENLKESIKNPENDLVADISKFYAKFADSLWKSFEAKKGNTDEIGIYIPSDELKGKYAEIVDLSLGANPVNWDDIVYKPKDKKKKTTKLESSLFEAKNKKEDIKGLIEWGKLSTVKFLLMGKLATRALIKAERAKGKSKLVWTKPVSRKISPTDINEFLDQHQEGNKVLWSGVNSCSTSFATWGGSVSTKIMPIGGLQTQYLSPFHSEKEVTLKPFVRMKVVSHKGEGAYNNFYNIKQIG